MAYSRKVIEKVRDELAEKRKKAELSAAAREEEMYRQCPVLREIDGAMSAVGIKIYKAALEGKDGLEERIAEIKKENLELRQAKADVLKASGKPENYLDIEYSCKKCRDTGYNGLEMCECMKTALVKASYESSGLGAVLTSQGFDSFRLDLYSDEKKNGGVSPRENMAYILRETKKYASSFGSEKNENLLFVGKTGLGKTHLSTAIAKSVIEKGYDVVYDTVQNIISSYEQQTFGHSEEAAENTARYAECALLIIDDLGTEFKSSFTQSVLYNLLNTRINAGRAMIISTNLDDSELFKKQYDDRINSRLIGNFRTFRFFGDDIRIKKTIMQNKK